MYDVTIAQNHIKELKSDLAEIHTLKAETEKTYPGYEQRFLDGYKHALDVVCARLEGRIQGVESNIKYALEYNAIKLGWKRVKLAAECYPCEACDEPVCNTCGEHYVDCDCPGPSQDDLYEYTIINEVLYAREREEE